MKLCDLIFKEERSVLLSINRAIDVPFLEKKRFVYLSVLFYSKICNEGQGGTLGWAIKREREGKNGCYYRLHEEGLF